MRESDLPDLMSAVLKKAWANASFARQMQVGVEKTLEFLLKWLFPSCLRTVRSAKRWQLVTARMVILNSLLSLRRATKGKWERKILALCPKWMQHFIKDRSPNSGDMLAVIALIEEVLNPKSAELAVLYAFHGPGVCYFGRCGARRWNQSPGFV